MNFGEKYIDMIKTLYYRAVSTVMNGGVTTGYFPLERAARQGDPISPTLFILALEPLLCVIRDKVQGIHTPKGYFKVAAFADDVTVGLGELDEVEKILKILKKFGKFSGLQINLEKCEILSLNGKVTRNNSIKETSYMKITGVTFGHRKNMCNIEKLNFEPAIQAIRSKLNLWKMRILTIMGKITVIKAHVLSQIQFLASSINTPEWVVKEVAVLVYNFVWNGRSKIKKEKASKAWKEGGLTLPQIENLCRAAFVRTTLRARELEDNVLWAKNFMHEMRLVGGEAALHPQTMLIDLKRKEVPTYVIDQIEAWRALQKAMNPEWGKEITVDSPICFNRHFKMPKVKKGIRGRKTTTEEVLDMPYLLQSGWCKAGLWFDPQGEQIKASKANENGVSGNAVFEWLKVSKSLKSARVRLVNDKELRIIHPPVFNPCFFTENGCIETSDITQKRILKEIAKAVAYAPNGTQIKVRDELDLTEDDFSTALKNYRKDNPCTFKQEFQFKLLAGILHTNKAFAGMGKKPSPKCNFCDEKEQSFVHLYIKCPGVNKFRETLAKNWQGEKMNPKRWFLGSSITNDVLEKCKNMIAKEANHFIFKTNWADSQLSVDAFKNWLKSDEEPEEALAYRVSKIFFFF